MRFASTVGALKNPFVIVLLALTLTVLLSQAIWSAGIERGVGALFWFFVVWSALVHGRWPGVVAALVGAAVFDFLFVPPVHSLDYGGPTFHIVMWSMVAAAVFLSRTRSRELVAIPPRFWGEAPTGDYPNDCDRGSQRADEYLRTLAMAQQCFLLGWMVRDMVNAGRFDGPEVGFFHKISVALLGANSIQLVIPPNDDTEDDGANHRIVETDDKVVPAPVG